MAFKIIAGRSYVFLAHSSQADNRTHYRRDILNAAFCYDRAKKMAMDLGFESLRFRCALRSAGLYFSLLECPELSEEERHNVSTGMDFAMKDIIAFTKQDRNTLHLHNLVLFGDGHPWFSGNRPFLEAA